MIAESLTDRIVAEPPGPARTAAFDHALDVLEDQRAEFNAQRYVPREYIALLKKAGMYRASTPAAFGGEPLPPSEFMSMVERISAVDPATGWVSSFGSSLVYFAALPVSTQEKIYAAGPDVAYAGGLFPMQEAEKVDGGYLCSGVWQFASGCRGADILGIGLKGGPETAGRPLTALVTPSDVEIVDNWGVAGMKATGSHSIRADRLFVPEEMTFVRGGAPRVDEPLTRYPSLSYAAQVLAVVTLGAARGALDYVREVGASRTSITGGEAKGNRPAYKTGLARAEAELRSARAFFYQITDDVWDKAVDGAAITPEDTALLRLSATHAAHAGRSVVLQAFDLAGTGAIYETHPLQRYLQDALVPAQHAMLQTNTYEAAGALLMGLEAGIPSFP
ncbi:MULTISPECIES: acyl-CoA dehydrogenase family protein [unclassified Rhodococcus (in: high G+C Gram-positive bacteria)]|uniref:acyl-CoA dehydrogenase family protein n=1 Tax=unclassified Rhodococcus (in: high G+C Gram-positive bacteria) TaxID=192944 RepID=UPI00096ABD28|nr:MULTISPECIES: acyl-CoA dehydrogenase family protein [unclassified Rhodococcus (in: high G+C Gram-positive bacteria)]